jgi:hypothetical protein
MSDTGCDAGFFTQLFQGNAIVCSDTYKSYLAGNATKQIIEDAQYAQSNYPGDAVVQSIQQDAIDTARQFSESEVNTVTSKLADNPSCDGLDFTFFGGPCITRTWIYVALGLAGAIFFFIYVAPVLGLLKRR